MTQGSFIASLIIAAAIAGVLSWLLRRYTTKSASAALGSSIGALFALPVLLHSSDGLSRIATPRVALEWIPFGLFLLSVFGLLHHRDVKRGRLWLGAGIACCLILAVRMMWGSVYLTPNKLVWTNITLLMIWVSSMAWIWSVRTTADPEKPSIVDGIIQLVLLLIVSVVLGLSGSITYFAAGLLFTVLSMASWIGGHRISTVTSVMTLGLLGLGPTFAETSWWVAFCLLLALLGLGIACLLKPGHKRTLTIISVLIVALAASVFTGYKFKQSISNKIDDSSGYESYR